MTIDTFVLEESPPLGLLDTHVEAFVGHLRAAGYAERTLRFGRPLTATSYICPCEVDGSKAAIAG